MSKIRVLIVDDSALMRKLLTEILSSDSSIEVVGAAMDAYAAREKIKALKPDVLTLDVEMPKMDGLQFLSNLMRLHPMPVIMVSSLTENGAEVTMRALDLGAVDFVSKPKVDLAHSLEDCAADIISKVKAAAMSRVSVLASLACKSGSSGSSTASVGASRAASGYRPTDQIIAIGASTGGTEAIKDVLARMCPDCPGVVIAQHIPPVFSRSFAKGVDQISPLTVCEASDGQRILPGHAFIAPGDQHLSVVKDGARYHCKLSDGPPVNRHRPSVEVLFRSVAECAGANAIGVMLTGMGRDGAIGMKEMHDQGAATVAQDEASSVVWGMPGAAVKEGAVDKVLPLGEIAQYLMRATAEGGPQKKPEAVNA